MDFQSTMGGASTWQFAVHYPDRWFAANPGAGFSETPDFLKVFQQENLQPTWWEQKLWRMYDCPYYAENFFNLPVVVWFMHSFINQVPLALEEAAVIDGCTRLQVLTRVVLPVSIPGLVATWLLAFSFAWNEFLFAVILTFNKATTLPVLIQAQQTERGTAWWAISSIGLVSIIPMIVFAILLQRRIVTGLLGGSER